MGQWDSIPSGMDSVVELELVIDNHHLNIIHNWSFSAGEKQGENRFGETRFQDATQICILICLGGLDELDDELRELRS